MDDMRGRRRRGQDLWIWGFSDTDIIERLFVESRVLGEDWARALTFSDSAGLTHWVLRETPTHMCLPAHVCLRHSAGKYRRY